MSFICVFESGRTPQPVIYFSPYSADPPNKPFLAFWIHGHEIDNLPDPFRRQETSKQDIRIRQIQLLGLHLFKHWANLVASTLFVIQQGGKDTRGIESWE